MRSLIHIQHNSFRIFLLVFTFYSKFYTLTLEDKYCLFFPHYDIFFIFRGNCYLLFGLLTSSPRNFSVFLLHHETVGILMPFIHSCICFHFLLKLFLSHSIIYWTPILCHVLCQVLNICWWMGHLYCNSSEFSELRSKFYKN